MSAQTSESAKLHAKKSWNVTFSATFDTVALAGNENKLLPGSLSWFGKDGLGLSAMYTMLKSKPEIMEDIN